MRISEKRIEQIAFLYFNSRQRREGWTFEQFVIMEEKREDDNLKPKEEETA